MSLWRRKRWDKRSFECDNNQKHTAKNRMGSEGGSGVTALSRSRSSLLTPVSPYFLDSAFPSESDLIYEQHSSEEELETINSSASSGQEKRKWSEVTPERGPGSQAGPQLGSDVGWLSRGGSSGCSSDEEVFGVEATLSTPVQFRTLPPKGTLKPTSSALVVPTAPAAALPDASPRKRHRLAPPRPSLNFEKMQQLQVKSLSTWRRSNEESPVYCW